MAAFGESKEQERQRLFRRHVPRPRLTRILEAASSQVVLISGPAGYGKTTLATEWLQGRDEVVWYRATPASADLAAFSAGLSDVIQPIVPGAGERLKQRHRVAEAPEKAARPLAEMLAEDVAKWPAHARAVVDDYHLVADSAAVEEFVDWLLLLSPIRLVVTTRRRPGWASARRVLYGEITEIGRDQLAMTHDEAAQVLGERSSESVRELVAQAEGWPALIGLAALCASAELPEERVSEALFRYFAEEVFRREPPDVQRFMLLASVPRAVSPLRAREILGESASPTALTRLIEDGLLYVRAPAELRFHPLLREFLRAKLRADDPELLRQTSHAAVAEARDRGNWQAAYELAIDVNETDFAVEVAADAADDMLSNGQIETLDKWLAASSSYPLTSSSVALAKAKVALRQARLSEAAALARTVAEASEAENPLASQAWSLAGQALHLQSSDHAALECNLRARDHARSVQEKEAALWGCFISAADLELEEATTYLNELEALHPTTIDARLRVVTGRVLAAERSGHYRGVWPQVTRLAPLVEACADPVVQSSFLARASEVCIGRTDYEQARFFADQAVAVCSTLHLNFALSLCLLNRATAEIGLRDFDAAKGTLERVLELSARHEDPYIALGHRSTTMKLQLATKIQFDPSLDELPTQGVQKNVEGALWGLTAIAHVAHGDLEDARSAAQKARDLTRAVEARYLGSFAELAVEAQEREHAAPNIGSRAASLLEQAASDDYLDAFVVAYRALPRLLRVFRDNPAASRIAWRVLQNAHDHHLSPDLGVRKPIRPPHRLPLTPRELEVLDLMARGMTNAEIARKLFISTSTAKVHVSHVLRKLGAKSRVQAIHLADELMRHSPELPT
jgi:LuxR family maltose regulon positive regulatory protein